jgi:hypothetical protein
MSEDADIWKDYREKKREQKKWHQENTTPKDLQLLQSLHDAHKLTILKKEGDGAGGDKYVIEVMNERGARVIDWWTATGRWKVRSGKGEGSGLYRFARYFQLIPKGHKL